MAGRAALIDQAVIQERFLELLMLTGNLRETSAELGITERTAQAWMARPQVQNAVFKARQAVLMSEGAAVGLNALISAARGDAGCPWNVRVQAGRVLVSLAGHSEAAAAHAAAAGSAGKPLQDMGPDELERLIAGASATLDQLRRPVVDATTSPVETPDKPDPLSLL